MVNKCVIGPPEWDIYTLFYVNKELDNIVNIKKDRKNSLETYFHCASVQSKLFSRMSSRYQVITNSADSILEISQDGGVPFDVRIEQFYRDVPMGIPFHSAHFKLDVIRGFGEGRFGTRPTLMDLDVLPVGRFSFTKFAQEDLLVYDITSQMSAEIGFERLMSDLMFLTERSASPPRWYGGEFISGSHKAFALLSEEIERIWPRYRDNIDRFAHVGDETIVSAALSGLAKKRLRIRDVGGENLIARWWSARTYFQQPQLSDISNTPLWHLPADKEFIAGLDRADNQGDDLRARYAAYVAPRLRKRQLLSPLLNLLRGEQKYAARA